MLDVASTMPEEHESRGRCMARTWLGKPFLYKFNPQWTPLRRPPGAEVSQFAHVVEICMLTFTNIVT